MRKQDKQDRCPVNSERARTPIHLFTFKKAAFTLAEILITLGIIGIVAALTIPNVISSYNKKVIETRLLKFYSNMNNAIALSEIDNGDKKYWDYGSSACSSSSYSQECLTTFFDTYLKPYLKYTKTEYKDNYLRIYFVDGSGVLLGYYGCDYNFYTVVSKIGKSIPGKDVFMFALYPNGTGGKRSIYFKDKGLEPYINGAWDGTKEDLYNYSNSYAKIIQLNGWKIPDDYPIKL